MLNHFKFLALVSLCLIVPCNTYGAASQQDKDYLGGLLDAMCSASDCGRTLNPNIPQEAREIISNCSYLVYNTSYDRLEKFNAPLKAMNIEGVMLIPSKWVEDALCKYYGLSLASYPELGKAAEEQGKYGFYPVGASDGGEASYSVEKVEIMKNGILRASGTALGDEPFVAYFAKSTCGGKPHWVPLRVVDVKPSEESEYFSTWIK